MSEKPVAPEAAADEEVAAEQRADEAADQAPAPGRVSGPKAREAEGATEEAGQMVEKDLDELGLAKRERDE